MSITITSTISIDRTSDLYLKLLAALPKITAKDFTLWGKAAEAESSIRLNWVDLPSTSSALLPRLQEMSSFITDKNLKHFILAGMGGSSLGPEVLAKTYGKSLTVLDATDPAQIAAATPQDLSRVAVIVGSKSGSTAETSSQKAYFTAKFTEAGLDPRDHFIIITDPGSPFDVQSRADGYFVVNADPNVGGRFSVLSAFGLVPAAAIGIDVSALLEDARSMSDDYSSVVDIAYAITTAAKQNIAFYDAGSKVPGLADWIEQLIAESTGKDGKGFLPIAIESLQSPVSGDCLKISFAASDTADIVVEAPLATQFLMWEYVTALLSIPLGINPFDQPNVTEAKTRAIALLDKWQNTVPALAPAYETENLQVFSLSNSSTLDGQIKDFLDNSPHYIAIMAYLARGIDDAITKLRPLVAEKSGSGTSFGWGPRFLHSTGQYHKGGIPNGAFIQVTGESLNDLDIPGKNFSFHTLLMAQALGDGEALQERKFPLIRFHLKNRTAGIEELLTAFRNLN
jgi:glucose-6-phosphate isomerase